MIGMADDKRMGLYIPRRLIDDWQLSSPPKMVYAVMLAAADADGLCSLSGREVGERCGMTVYAASQNRRKLLDLGYLDKVIDELHDFYCLKHLEVKRDG